jgi:hypothetical protein
MSAATPNSPNTSIHTRTVFLMMRRRNTSPGAKIEDAAMAGITAIIYGNYSWLILLDHVQVSSPFYCHLPHHEAFQVWQMGATT